MRLPLTIGLPSARRLLIPVAAVALVIAAGVALGPHEIVDALKSLGRPTKVEPAIVPFDARGVVPAPNWLSQLDADGNPLPAGGWSAGAVTISFRAESDEIGAIEPEVELVRIDDVADVIRLLAPRFDIRTGEGAYLASATISDLPAGEYVWRARFIQNVTSQVSTWSSFGGVDRCFGVVGDVPRITHAYLDGGRLRPSKPPLVGAKNESPFRWITQATPAASLSHFAYTVDREETAPQQPPSDATRLGPGVRTLPVGERDDGWWYLHIWPVDQLGRIGAPETAPVSVLRTPPDIYGVAYRTMPTTPPYQSLPIRFKLSQAAEVSVSILTNGGGNAVRTYDLGRHGGDLDVSLSWDGRDAGGRIVPVGAYSFSVHAVDDAGNPSDMKFDGLLISNRAIRVSLANQSMTAWEGDNVALSTLVTTGGQELPTPAGNFQILSKSAPFTFHSPWPVGSPYWYPNATVRMAMLFSDVDQTFIHDNGARTRFGPGTNGPGAPGSAYGGSHGCINVPTDVMYKLFDWSAVGTPVIVQ